MKDLKYFCQECKLVKSAKFEMAENPNSTVPIPTEIVRKVLLPKSGNETNEPTNGQANGTRETKERQLECEHWVEYSTPGFTDASTEHLNEFEIQEIRRTIDKSILGLDKQALELKILMQVDIYETHRKIAAKQQKQAKYAQMYLEQLKDRYKEQLSEEDKQKLDMKFAASLEQRPTANRTIERDIAKADKEANTRQQAAIKAMQDLLKMGYDPKQLFNKGE